MFGRFFQRFASQHVVRHLRRRLHRICQHFLTVTLEKWKPQATKETARSIHYPIRDRAEICVSQIRVSLHRSVCGCTPCTDRERRRSNKPFASWS